MLPSLKPNSMVVLSLVVAPLKSAPKFRSILVLCEGNHCRSPIAKVLLASALPDFQVVSAGLAALEGYPAHAEAQRLMAERGLDLSLHVGMQLTSAIGLAADLILVMDEQQKNWCESLVPNSRGRVFLLGHWLPKGQQEIIDPFRKGPVAFSQALLHIDQAVATWVQRMTLRQRLA